MDQMLAILAIVMLVATGLWLQYRLSRGRMWTPLWLAFTATAASVLFTSAGMLGYRLSKGARFDAGTAWASSVIWWQIGVGFVLAGVAAILWRQGVQSLRRV
jgi:hypothetical protein